MFPFKKILGVWDRSKRNRESLCITCLDPPEGLGPLILFFWAYSHSHKHLLDILYLGSKEKVKPDNEKKNNTSWALGSLFFFHSRMYSRVIG